MIDGLLVRHFVRRFLDNDLISPDADRHAVLAVIAAACSMSGLFLTVFLSMRYLFRTMTTLGAAAWRCGKPAIGGWIASSPSRPREPSSPSGLGTVSYISPEQARGEDIDARSDQFSFGLIPASCAPACARRQG